MEVCRRSFNELTIEQDVPAPERCCFCIPHRLGLYVLALLKLVVSLVMLIVIFITLFLLLILGGLELFYYIIALLFIAILITLVDFYIGIVAVVSLCVKDTEFLKQYYRYTVYVFGSMTIFFIVISSLTGGYIFFGTDIFSRQIIVMSTLLCILLSILVLQVCLNKMVKTEVLILRSNEQFLL